MISHSTRLITITVTRADDTKIQDYLQHVTELAGSITRLLNNGVGHTIESTSLRVTIKEPQRSGFLGTFKS